MLHVNRMENTTSQNLKPALFVSFGNKQICHHLRWRISCVYPGMFTAIFPLMEWESLHHLSIVSSHASWNLNWFPHSPQQNTPLSGPGDSQTGIGSSDDYFYLVASYFWTTAIWCQADDAPLRPRKIHTKFLAGSLGPKGSASPTVLAQLHIL